ncbi:membrane glycoprotein UL40 [Cercopithecine betaherpesvirus 5]|uniref:Membrane glycoprotein UL40 n=1 Tax=Simian cytomegalovirus (strain Colburn) TaxID=50292 RepID=G8XTU5_SCMVC|nr:membrane glycoprotein UL40 [Cercopithecine betaherpesvirus 5]
MSLLCVAVMAPRTLLLIVGFLAVLSGPGGASASERHTQNLKNCSVVYHGVMYLREGNGLKNFTVQGRYCLPGAILNIVLNSTVAAEICPDAVMSNVTYVQSVAVHGSLPTNEVVGVLSCPRSENRLFSHIQRHLGLYPALSLGLETMWLYTLCALSLSIFSAFYPQMAYVDNPLPKTPVSIPNKKLNL